MNVSSPRCIAPSLLLLAACASPERVRYSDDVFPNPTPFYENGWYVRRLVDDASGEPIAGAEVFLVEESGTPITGEFWFTAKGTSDADGFVRIAVPGLPRSGFHMQVARHTGHAVTSQSYDPNPIWRIGRPFDVPVRIEDWCGRPVGGALVGFCGGCGHTPDLVNATTDADGVAVLRGIDPQNHIRDVYVHHPGVGLGYRPIDWYPGDPPRVVPCSYSPPKSGRVLDHRGQPVAGAFVGALDVHRGPWARTAADGTFTILGSNRNDRPHVVVMPSGRKIHFAPPRTSFVTLQLPDLADEDAYQGTAQGEPDAVGEVATRTVRVVVNGAPGPVKVGAYHPDVPPEAQLELQRTSSDLAVVPVRRPFKLSVWGDGGSRDFSFDDASEGTEPLVVAWVPDVRITGRAVDTNGAPLDVSVRWRASWTPDRQENERELLRCDAGRIDLPCTSAGLTLVEVAPARADLLPRFVWITVPPRGGTATVDLGDVVLSTTPQLRLTGAPGGATVGVARAGLTRVGSSLVWPLGAGGEWRGPDLRAGDTIVVEHRGERVPFRAVLRGDPPWTVGVPDGVVELTVTDDAGAPLRAQLVIGDHEEEVRSGSTTLRGLTHGAHRLFVAADGHRIAIVDTLVGDEPKVLRVVLPRR